MGRSSWLVVVCLLLALTNANPHPKAHANIHARARPQQYYANPYNQGSPSSSAPASVNTGVDGDGDGSTTTGTTSTSVGDIKFPAGCASKNGYHIGVQMDGDPSPLKQSMGAYPCIYGRFADIATMEGISDGVTNANNIGAILMLSLKTTTYNVNAASVASQLNNMAKTVKAGVWLRLGHEMTMNGPEGNYPHNGKPDIAAYVKLWQDIAGAVDRTKIKTYWCANPPTLANQNWNDLSWMNQYYPGDAAVDIAGIDTYAEDGNAKFQYGLAPEFCKKYGNKPIFVGELGVKDGGDASTKLSWATQALSSQVKGAPQNCGSYIGFSWFEISKDNHDYRAAGNGILKNAMAAAQ